MGPFTGETTHAQLVALAVAPKIAGMASLCGSGYIIYDILRHRLHTTSGSPSRRRKELTTYHRLMVGLSACDMAMSFGLFTTTWGMPKDSTVDVWGAVGTVATCEAIGFLEQFGVSAVLYSGSLSLFYLLRIKYGWNDSKMKSSRIEIWLHLIPLLFGIVTCSAGIPLQLYNSGIFDCWIAPYPLNCQQSWTNPNINDPSYVPCIRGDNASIYQWAFDIVPKFSSIFLVTINMMLTYWSVKRTETKSMHFSMKKNQLSRRMARQSYLYVGALWLTYCPVAMTRMTQLVAGHTYYGMILTIALLLPLQGCWNVAVYLRPRYIKIRKRQQKETQRRHRMAQQQQRLSHTEPSDAYSGASSGGSGLAGGYFLRAVSEAVREGELADDENDGDDDINNNNDDDDDDNDDEVNVQSPKEIEQISHQGSGGSAKNEESMMFSTISSAGEVRDVSIARSTQEEDN